MHTTCQICHLPASYGRDGGDTAQGSWCLRRCRVFLSGGLTASDGVQAGLFCGEGSPVVPCFLDSDAYESREQSMVDHSPFPHSLCRGRRECLDILKLSSTEATALTYVSAEAKIAGRHSLSRPRFCINRRLGCASSAYLA
jgi:hypothetical protein